MNTRTRHLFVITISLVLLFLGACGSVTEPPLRVGTNVWPGYEPLYLARSLKFYDNTAIHLVELPSASEVMHAMRNGLLEAAALTLDEALVLLADDFDLKVILIMDFSHGSDVLLSKPEIQTLSDLAGKRIAVETTAVGAILLNGALEQAKLSATDIEIVNCSFDRHVECYQSADAIVTFEPAKTKLIEQGARNIFNSSHIPGKIIDVLVVQNKAAATNPKTLKQLIAGYFKARQHFSTYPEESAKLMAGRMGIPPKEVILSFNGLKLPSLEENRSLLSGDQAGIQKTTRELAAFLYKKSLLKKEISISNLTNPGFLPAKVEH
jgi:NitT/TauT family transport system substrate-binding protein